MALTKSSKARLSTCHIDIQKVVLALAEENSIQVIEGRRLMSRQKELFKQGATKTLNSKHVTGEDPSEAVDLAPLINGQIEWKNYPAFVILAEKFMAKAKELYEKKEITSKFRWGGDWNRNGDWKDENFRDMPHFEIDN
jgi:peptidoglycan L-alanyl-D-glutamate endopeptidase CwlK